MPTKEMQSNPPALRTKVQEKRENMVKRAWDETTKYLKGVKTEFQRVTWPTAKELRYNTLVVIFVTIGISTYMWIVDKALTLFFRFFHHL